MPLSHMEILAPAGGKDSLVAAARCGADAVYLGGSSLNARRSAANFDEQGLAEAVAYCHARGIKVYQTLNTLVLKEDMDELARALAIACDIGIDAVLVQDLAVAEIAKAACPDLELHASTQMSIHNAAGAKMLEKMGFSRVVLARELSLAEIAVIRQNCDIELEVFVHGALCMSISGQCYLSSMIGGRSGNRGLCAQPCRLPFAFGEQSHALSLRDLSLLNRIEDLAEAGVCSLKIEGRMKRPEYVAAAVTACREARDGIPPNFEELASVFSRSGFTQGYLDNKRDKAMFGIRQKEDVTAATDALLGKYAALYRNETQRVPVRGHLTVHPGQLSRLTLWDNDGNEVTVTGEVPQQARTAPTDGQKAAAALQKTGGTVFDICDLDFAIAPGLMLPASALNALRREGLDKLYELRAELRPLPFSWEQAKQTITPHMLRSRPEKPRLRLRLGRADQLSAALASDAELTSLPAYLWHKAEQHLLRQNAERLAIELPKYLFGSEDRLRALLSNLKDAGITHALAGSLGAISLADEFGFQLHGDYSLNVTNTVALEAYRGLRLSSCTLSFELLQKSARSLGGLLPRGLIAYGYLPLMALRNCPVKAHGEKCSGKGCDYPTLRDRKNKEFFVDCDGEVSILHNCVPLWMGDKPEALKGLDFATLYFTKETPEEVGHILRLYGDTKAFEGEFTRGLYLRGVQ